MFNFPHTVTSVPRPYFTSFTISLYLIVSAAVTGREAIVKVGDEVTLSCGNVDKDHDSCDDIEWLFADSGGTPSVVLIRSGQIGEHAGDKSDRLRVTEKNCSLVLKNVTAKDVGQYTCIPHTNLISVITSEYLYQNIFSSNCLIRTICWNTTTIRVMKFILLLLSFSHNISNFTSDWTSEGWWGDINVLFVEIWTV